MSRGKLHCVVVIVAFVGILAVAPPRAEAAGGVPVGSDFWSHALRWVASWWDGVLNVREDEGGMIDPNGAQAVRPASPADGSVDKEWWSLEPDH